MAMFSLELVENDPSVQAQMWLFPDSQPACSEFSANGRPRGWSAPERKKENTGAVRIG